MSTTPISGKKATETIINTLSKKILEIQKVAVVAKGEQAKNYAYRNIDDLYEVIAPKLDELSLVIKYDEEVIPVGETRAFINCRLTITDTETKEVQEVQSVSEIPLNPGIMSSQQATKAAVTFARKQTLESLFRVTSPEETPENYGQKTPLLPKGGKTDYFG